MDVTAPVTDPITEQGKKPVGSAAPAEFNPFSSTNNLTQVTKAIYGSPLYAKASPEMKKKVDSVLYQKYTKLSNKMFHPPLSQEDWGKLPLNQRADPMRLLGEYSYNYLYENQRRAVVARKVADTPSWGDYQTIAQAGAVAGTLDMAQGALHGMAGFLRDPNQSISGMIRGEHKTYEEKGLIGRGLHLTAIDIAKGFEPGTKHDYLEDVSTMFDKAADYVGNKKAAFETDFNKGFGNTINDHMTARIVHGMGYIGPSIAAYETGGRVLSGARLANIESLKLSDFLNNPNLSGKTGRTLLRATQGALDGYMYSAAGGESPEKQRESAATFAGFESIVGPVGGKVLGGVGNAAIKLYSKLGNIYGARFVASSIQNTVHTMEASGITKESVGAEAAASGRTVSEVMASKFDKGFWESSSTDPLITRINETNAKVLNDTAKQLFGEKATYHFSTPEQKKQIVALVTQHFTTAIHFPAAFDEEGAQVEYTHNTQVEKAENPEVGRIISGLERDTQQVTGSPVLKAAVEKMSVDARAEAKAAAQEILTPTPRTTPQRIVPGAARADTSEFDARYPGLLKALSLNEYPEKVIDALGIQYMGVQRGNIKGAAANRITKAYEDAVPDPLMRYGHLEGLKEHLIKLFHTDHLGKGENIFRSGNYMHEDLRDLFGLPKTEWQEELDEEWRHVNKGKDDKSPSLEKTISGKLKLGINKDAVIDMFAGQQYSNRNAITVVKELIQNAADAIRELGGFGKVTVKHDFKNGEHFYTVSDNGVGMSRNELFTVFSNLAESGKRASATASGGFGLAKAALFRLPEQLEVSTAVRVPGKGYELSTFTSTPKMIVGEGVDINTKFVKDTKGIIPGDGTGTVIRAKFKGEEYDYAAQAAKDHAVDSQRSINFPGKLEVIDKFGTAVEPYDYDESYNRVPVVPPEHIDTITTPNKSADIDIYTAKGDPLETGIKQMLGVSKARLEIHNNGIYQFHRDIGLSSKAPKSLGRIIVDVKSRVPETHLNYPFTTNREALKGGGDPASNVESFVQKTIQDKIINPAQEKMKKGLADVYQNLPKIPGTSVHILDSGNRLTPDELKVFTDNTWFQRTAKLGQQIASEFIDDLVGSKDNLLSKTSTAGLDGVDRPGGRTEKFGLMFTKQAHGVSVPDPAKDSKKVAIFINPFSQYPDVGKSPESMARRFVNTIVHELAHDTERGHGADFAGAWAKIMIRTDPKKYFDAVQMMEEHYGSKDYVLKRHNLFNAEYEKLIQLYDESRGRDEVSPDIFTLED